MTATVSDGTLAHAQTFQWTSIAPPVDLSPPVVTLMMPTTDATYTTESDFVVLGGTAIDDSAVSAVRWSNDRGGTGHDVFTLGEEGGERLRARVYLGDGNDEATVRTIDVLDLRIDGGANGDEADEKDILRAVADIAGMTARRFESVLIIP